MPTVAAQWGSFPTHTGKSFVSSNLSLLAELPVDSCTSSASLIRKLGRPTAANMQSKLFNSNVMPSWNCLIIKTKKINVEIYSLGLLKMTLQMFDFTVFVNLCVCSHVCFTLCVCVCVYLARSVTQRVWYHNLKEHKLTKSHFRCRMTHCCTKFWLLLCMFWSRANCFISHKSFVLNVDSLRCCSPACCYTGGDALLVVQKKTKDCAEKTTMNWHSAVLLPCHD